MSKENNINQEIPGELKNTKKSSVELNAESNTNIKKDVNDNNKAFKEKIDELKYFDAIAHFKENIIHFIVLLVNIVYVMNVVFSIIKNIY